MAWSCNKLSEMFHCVRFDLLDDSFQLTKRKNRPVNLTESSETLLNSMSFKGDVPAHLTGNPHRFLTYTYENAWRKL